MSSPRPRRAVALALLVLALAACGRGSDDPSVAAGAPGQDPTATSEPVTASTTVPPDTAGTVATGTEGEPSPSVVEGLSVQDVQAAVAAPTTGTTRRLAGPTVERLVLPSGATVWRVRIPGEVPVRSARATISVGDRPVGTAITAATLDALVAITTDGTGLVAGAPVSYRWEGGRPIAAGPLEVAR